jgi:hypothetical protein
MIVRILYLLISVEFVSTLLLVPMTVERAILFGVAIAGFTVLCARMATGGRCQARTQDEGAEAAPG